MRFVVLLTADIKKVGEVIEAGVRQGFWEASKDRDYEKERLDKPLEFSYQSVHYVLRAKAGIVHQGYNIPEGASSEVQIRTLLQHAHSELTHDTLYKPKTTAQSEVKRTVAKSMALIEATDEFFEKAIKDLDEAACPGRELLEFTKAGPRSSPAKSFPIRLLSTRVLNSRPNLHTRKLATFCKPKGLCLRRSKSVWPQGTFLLSRSFACLLSGTNQARPTQRNLATRSQ
jgi:hypothetical protein